MTNRTKKIIGFVVICALVAVAIFLTVRLWPWLASLIDDEGREAFKAYVTQLGFRGWLLLLAIQVLQVILAVLPGEPVEIIAGYLYGTWGGLLTCLLGIMIGTAIIFLMVKLLKDKFITLFISKEKLEGYKFLNNAARLESITFILFLIPGTPKDALTYAVALTKIKPLRFFLIATFARIPSVVSSTWAGASIVEGNWILTAVIFGATAVLGLLGIWLNKKYTQKLEEKNAESA